MQKEKNESIRLTVSITIVASTVAIWSGLREATGIDVLVLFNFIFGMLSFTYIMLTGTHYLYRHNNAIGSGKIFQWIREKIYNLSIRFYWYSLLMIAYIIIIDSLDVSKAQINTLSLYFSLFSILLTAALIIFALVYKVIKREVKSSSSITFNKSR